MLVQVARPTAQLALWIQTETQGGMSACSSRASGGTQTAERHTCLCLNLLRMSTLRRRNSQSTRRYRMRLLRSPEAPLLSAPW